MEEVETFWEQNVFFRALFPALSTIISYILGNYVYYLEWFPQYNEVYSSILVITGGSVFTLSTIILTKDNTDSLGITAVYSGLICIVFTAVIFLGNCFEHL